MAHSISLWVAPRPVGAGVAIVLMATVRIELSSTTISRLSIRTPRIAQRRRCTASGIREAGTAGVVMASSLGHFRYETVSYRKILYSDLTTDALAGDLNDPFRDLAHTRALWPATARGATMGESPGTPSGRLEMTEGAVAMTQLSAAQTVQNSPSDGSKALYGGKGTRRITVRDIALAKERGEKWPMLTAYDAMTASVFDEAGIPVILVGDSAGNCHLGYDTTVPVTLDEMTMLSAAVVRGTQRALIVGDLPFGSYQEGPVQALRSATRLVKEAGVGAVKLEGGERSHEQIRLLVDSGIPVMAHIGLTPQSVNAMGYRVQGRGEEAAAQLLRDAKAVQDAGAFAVVLELVPADLAAEVTRVLHIPTVGIGAGPETDAQVLVWTDMLGLTGGRVPKFVKQYADLRQVMGNAARAFAEDVVGGVFPSEENSVH